MVPAYSGEICPCHHGGMKSVRARAVSDYFFDHRMRATCLWVRFKNLTHFACPYPAPADIRPDEFLPEAVRKRVDPFHSFGTDSFNHWTSPWLRAGAQTSIPPDESAIPMRDNIMVSCGKNGLIISFLAMFRAYWL